MVGRAEKVAQAQKLRAEGLSVGEIANRMNAPRSTVSEYLSDPDLAKHFARRRKNGGVCACCGAPTDGSRAQPAKHCRRCAEEISVARLRERGRIHRQLVERLWAEGKTAKEICTITGRSINISTLRKQGYNLPHRRRHLELLGKNGTPEAMAYARAARR